MANSTIANPNRLFTDPLSNIAARASLNGIAKTLCIIQPSSAMTYNVGYDAGTLPSSLRPSGDTQVVEFIGNGRKFKLRINANDGKVTITPLTNDLPSNGKPAFCFSYSYI